MESIKLILQFLIVLCVYLFAFWRGRKWERVTAGLRMPYRWDCREEGCSFHAESNNVAATDHIASNHVEYHRRR